jgi:hypothetical protein
VPNIAQVTVATDAPTTSTIPIPATTTTIPGGQKFLTNMCVQSTAFCFLQGSNAQSAIQYGQAICKGLRTGGGGTTAIKDTLEAQKVVATKVGVNAKNAITIVVAAVTDLCPKYLQALRAYANNPNNPRY